MFLLNMLFNWLQILCSVQKFSNQTWKYLSQSHMEGSIKSKKTKLVAVSLQDLPSKDSDFLVVKGLSTALSHQQALSYIRVKTLQK